MDRDSLAELWRTGPGEFPAWTGSGLLVQSDPPRLLDQRTGQVRTIAGGWDPVYNLSGSSVYQEAMPAPMTRQVDQRTYLARQTPQAIRLLGVIPRLLHDSQYHDRLLACTTVDDRTGVWWLSAS